MLTILAAVTLVFALAWGLVSVLRAISAAMRHTIWTCAIAAALVIPVLRWKIPESSVLPARTLPVSFVVTVPAATSSPAGQVHDFQTVLFPIWAVGALLMLGRLAASALTLRPAARNAQCRTPIRISAQVRSPLITGIFRPVILLPADSTAWPAERKRAVIAHEAAHIRRRDPAILFAAHLATAVYWFHPLCWLAAARLRAESERACDDAALRAGLQPSGYAGHLLDLARRFDTRLAIPMAATSHLESRVKSILDPKINRSVSGPFAWAAALAITALLLVPLTTLDVRAQTGGTAAISGTVYDPSGAVVPRARLTATNADGGYVVEAESDSAGVYSFKNLPAGHYTIEADSAGFVRFHLGDLALVSGGHIQVDARLAVGGIKFRSVVSAQNPAPPEALTVAPQRIRVGGNVQPSVLLKKIDAEYPADLRAQGIEGTVLLDAIISKDGVPLSMKLQNTGVNQEFVDAAKAAFSQWRLRPTLLNGEPVEVMTTIQIDFRLSNPPAKVIDDKLRDRR